MSLSSTEAWWALLRAVAIFNVLAWVVVALQVWRRRQAAAGADDTLAGWQPQRWQLLLSAGYVAGCAWRSMLPVYDVPRLVMVDSIWSSVLVGRSVATLAELCFAAQWALLLRGLSRPVHSRPGLLVSHAVLPLILTAEVFSWYSVLTTSNIGHVVEEALWGLTAALLVASLVLAWPHVQPARRPILLVWCVAGMAYVAYMFAVDVPMYWSRWLADEAAARPYLALSQGLSDVAGRWVVSHDWAHWQSEVVWMTAYFSGAVWLSLALVLVPRLHGPLRPSTAAGG
jgi:hypothetical protein